MGRMANYSDELAEAVVANEILPQLVYSLAEQNRFYKKAAAFVLRAVAKHSPALAQVGARPGSAHAYMLSINNDVVPEADTRSHRRAGRLPGTQRGMRCR